MIKRELHNEAFKNIGNGKGLLEGKEESSNLNMNSLSTLEVLKGIESYKQNNAVIIGKTDGGEKASTEGTQVSSTKVEQLKAQIENILKDNGIEPSSVSKEAGKITEALIALVTKENISMVKSMLEFSNKVSGNPDEIKQFIEAYLSSRDIPANSVQGMAVVERLTEFLEAFSKAGKDSLLFFLENNIDFSKENLESFNKLFKGDTNINEVLNEVKNKFVQEANTTISNNNLADNINKTGSFFNNIEQAGINDKTELHNEAFKNIGNGKGLLEGKEESSNLNMNSLSTLEVLKGIESRSRIMQLLLEKLMVGKRLRQREHRYLLLRLSS